MIWIPIVAGAILLIVISLLIFFYRMAFVRGKDSDISAIAPKTGEYEGYFKQINDGVEWFDNQPKRDAYITSEDGLKLHASILTLCENADKTIILFHGYRSVARKDFACAISMYTSFNMNVILVDQRAHGKSEGRIISYGVKERFDARDWVEFAKKEFPGTKIYMSGLSMGSATVMMASDIVEGVSGIVADCGFTSPKEIIQKVAKEDMHLPKWLVAPVGLMARIFGGFDYSYSAKTSLAKTNVPILFIHGGKDAFVPCYMTEENFEACASKKKKVIVEEAIHGFSYLVDPETVTEALKGFILGSEE